MVEFLALVAAAMLGFKCMKNPVILFPTITAVLVRKKLDVYALNAYHFLYIGWSKRLFNASISY